MKPDPFIDQITVEAQRLKRKADLLEWIAPRLPSLPESAQWQSINTDCHAHATMGCYVSVDTIEQAVAISEVFPPAPALNLLEPTGFWFVPMAEARSPGVRVQPIVYQAIGIANGSALEYTSFLQWYTYIEQKCIYVAVAIRFQYGWFDEDKKAHNIPEGEHIHFESLNGDLSEFVFWHYLDWQWKAKLTAVMPREDDEWASVLE